MIPPNDCNAQSSALEQITNDKHASYKILKCPELCTWTKMVPHEPMNKLPKMTQRLHVYLPPRHCGTKWSGVRDLIYMYKLMVIHASLRHCSGYGQPVLGLTVQ
mmetsp:Transcript_97230/g.178196  ORF Transcript_97230/g.178196 Transcript_97230/m.178196 type:complete len:104 (+) Transcript_97230:111-422(+)